MKKNVIRLNEGQIRNIIRESVKKVLKEGMTTDNPAYDKWEYLLETIGAESMVNNIFNYLDDIAIEKIVGWFEEDGFLDGYADEYGEEY